MGLDQWMYAIKGDEFIQIGGWRGERKLNSAVFDIWLEQLRYTVGGYILAASAVIFIAGFIQLWWRSR